ncbi:translocation/assembly module TamB domain-containing protein [Oligoflexus tunisiensis]|uniref:translocation/assembly module TamB domain-containing protein n=1 Tax=Oligoflexus tunisiensis TaxID=708132 RepID=UPI000A6444EF|nr:translocation/assembly module TamB domain-containing protein [Oligoflexus tunisiensis]
MGILRGFLKFLLGLVTTLVILVGLALGGLFYILNRQEFTFPETTLRWVAGHVLEPMNILVTFKTLDARLIRTSDEDWYARRLVVRSENLDVTMPDFLQTHIPDLDLQLGLNFHPQRYGIKGIGPIDASGVRLNLKLAKEDPKKEEKPFDYQLWLDRLQAVRFEPIRLGFQSLVIQRPGEPKMEAQLYANLRRQEGNRWSISVRADRVKGIPARKANFDLQLDLPEGSTLLPLAAQIKGRVDLGKLGWARLAGDGRLEAEDRGEVKLDLTSRFQGKRQELKASGRLNQERFTIKVSGQANQPVDALRQVELNGCELEGILRRKGKPFLQSNLDCRVGLTRVPAPEEKPFQDMLPRDFDFRIQGPISIASWDKNPIFKAPLKITLQPLLSQLYTLRGQTSVELSGRVMGGVDDITATIDVSSQLAFDRFQPVVKRLEETDFAVPAPFNTLDGRIYCNIEGRIRKMGAIMDLPLDCGTELSSVTQSMFIQARGTIEKEDDQKPVIRLAIGLNKLTFELPRLALNGSVPQLFPDQRIMTAEERAKEAAKADDALPVVLDLHITTPPDRPMTLVTSLQPIPVPISMDLTLKGDRIEPQGTIGVHQYRVTFFKQKAFVDHIRVILSPDEEQPLLDGLVVFQDPDVKINLRLSGTVDRPFYELDSVPPRSPTELVSIMLYGGDPEALDDENLRSVDETRAAMVDGAIGLMSMYYLASTPIDSVGYNPYTGQFRARVRVAQGLSLTLGSDLGGVRQSVTLRKRLTENWSFETGAETDEETHESKGIAMFKWGRRY